MENGIGILIYRLREEAGYTQEQLCRGLCAVSELARIETSQLLPRHLMLDRLFGRMGKSTERLEYVLPIETYNQYEIRNLIQKNICHMELDRAEQLLNKYENSKQADKKLHRQYIQQMRAQIAWIRGEKSEEILQFIDQAICQTMLKESSVEKGMALSAEELKLLLFRWEVCRGTMYARTDIELNKILKYIINKEMETTELVKVFPYAVLLMGKTYDKVSEYDMLYSLVIRALSLLREEGKLLYMPEILELYIGLLEYKKGDKKIIEKLKGERASILAVEAEFHTNLEKFPLYQHVIRRFEVDYELVKTMRIAEGITQEELSDGICTQETLSRIENGRRSPQDKKMYKLMDRMNRRRERVSTIVVTTDYEVLSLKKQLAKELHRSNYEKAGYILDVLESKLNFNSISNLQFIRAEKVKIYYHKKEWDWIECLEELKNLLKLTTKWEDDDNTLIDYEFTIEENSILNEMGLIYYENGMKDKAIRIFEMQIQKFRESRVNTMFRILDWELAMGNLATIYEETHQYSEAIKLSKEKIQVSVDSGKGNGIGRSLITMAGALEHQRDDTCVKYFSWGMDMLKLYKMENRYEIMEEYVSRPEFSYKDKLIRYRLQDLLRYEEF